MRPILLALLLAICAAPAPARAVEPADSSSTRRHAVIPGEGMLRSDRSSNSLAARETAGPDTFAIYGGPDHPTEGKFELANGSTADWGGGNGLPGGYGGGPGAWTPVDLTAKSYYWHQDTFNAENLNGNGPGNHALWCGVAAGSPEAAGWISAPGYGNNWTDLIEFVSAPVADPSMGELVTLEFYFNYETEPNYDFFFVEYQRLGTWTRVATIDGTNKSGGVFAIPGEQFSAVAGAPIQYNGNDYAGVAADRIRIRIGFESDGGWSDEDGLQVTEAGAVQIDDISLSTSLGVFVEDFESAGPYLFQPAPAPFAGDFADVHPLMSSIDPCRSNHSPMVAFIDYGQEVRNGPGFDGTPNTGGSTRAGVNYGIPGSYVTNYTKGLSEGSAPLTNEIWSPEILWDQPGTDDDGPDVVGAQLRFDVWADLPFIEGIYYTWSVRNAAVGEDFSDWRDDGFVYHGPEAEVWRRLHFEVTPYLEPDPERVQIALGVRDLADAFSLPPAKGNPSPAFDNVSLYKYRIGGPVIRAETQYLAQDGFPVNGSIDVSTEPARGALDIPFSMARDVNTGDIVNVPGDSIAFWVESKIPGTTLTDIRMVWALDTNPLFGDALRSAPARPEDQNVVAGSAGTIWTGEVEAGESVNLYSGLPIPDRYYADLPDQDFLYPGDVLHYYIQATDSGGRTTTLPEDLTGFGMFGPGSTYDRAFRVRGLPTLTDTAASQPEILVYNEFGRLGGEAEWVSAFGQLGYGEGVGYDSYTVQAPRQLLSNGIGSAGAHGATPAQLAGYSHVFHFTGDLDYRILSANNTAGGADKEDDVATLTAWLATPGTRNIVHAGDGILTGNSQTQTIQNYVTDVMGASRVSSSVRDVIGGQTAPRVVPDADGTYAAYFGSSFGVYGGCTTLNSFDHIEPLPGAEAGHWFTAVGDPAAELAVASIIHPLANGYAVTLPYDPLSVQDLTARAVGLPARTVLIQEILELFGAPPGGTATGVAPGGRRAQLTAAPNPFNPLTVVEFTAAVGSRGSIRVYNLRGELVRTLHEGEFVRTSFTWDGTDNQGAGVASGVYVVRGDDGTTQQSTKVALVK